MNLYEDKEQFAELLISISYLGRLSIHKSIDTLIYLFNDHFNQLRREFAQQPEETQGEPDKKNLFYVYEKFYWIIECINYILADTERGEVSSIPDAIVDLSKASGQGSLGENDKVIELIELMFQLVQFHNEILLKCQDKIYLLSSFIGETLIGFIIRWSKSYLMNDFVSSSHVQLKYSKNSKYSIFIVEFILDCIFNFLIYWNQDIELTCSVSKLLLHLSTLKSIRLIIHNFPQFIKIQKIFFGESELFPSNFLFSSSDKTIRNFSQSLIQFGDLPLGIPEDYFNNSPFRADFTIFNQAQMISYYQSLFNSIELKFFSIIQNPDFLNNVNHPNIISQIIYYIQVLSSFPLRSYPSLSPFSFIYFTLLFSLYSFRLSCSPDT